MPYKDPEKARNSARESSRRQRRKRGQYILPLSLGLLGLRRCTKCYEVKELNDFSGRDSRCKPCNSIRVVERLVALRLEAVAALGTTCALCEETENLDIDHVEGGGSLHRAAVGANTAYYKQIIEEANSGKYRLLCVPHNRRFPFPVFKGDNGGWIVRGIPGKFRTREGAKAVAIKAKELLLHVTGH